MTPLHLVSLESLWKRSRIQAVVLASYTTQCRGAAAPLRAIGNEAVMCAADTKGHTHGEHVIGRVRDQIFTVTVTTSARQDPSMPREALEEKTRNIAEQVAGALF